MVGYRCYILDAEDHIVQAHNLDCDSDMQAQREAGNFLSKDPYHSYVEIWRATRRVAKLETPRRRSSSPVPSGIANLQPATVLP